ncbi:MAG TPA: metallophosphoesterase [Spirochaetota bacterium]|nr:metallophosphoesterase [Spirochaetota bacterium]
MDRHRTTRARYAGVRAALWAALFALALFLHYACTRPVVEREADDISFALIGNTLPESPFGSMSPRVPEAIARLNADNPVFTVHLGNIVYGGRQWMGIKEDDVTRQYREFRALRRTIRSIVYTVRGEMDGYNDSSDLYRRYTGRAPYYSFNYGNVHCVVIDTCDPEPGSMGLRQRAWLESDLEHYRTSPAIFVFAHHSLVPVKNETAATLKDAPALLELFAKYPVKAVFSGQPAVFNIAKSGEILCVTAGSGGFNREEQYRRRNHYYVVSFSGGVLRVSERQAN